MFYITVTTDLAQIDPLPFRRQHRYDVGGEVLRLGGLRQARLQRVPRVEGHLPLDEGAVLRDLHLALRQLHAELELRDRVEAFPQVRLHRVGIPSL